MAGTSGSICAEKLRDIFNKWQLSQPSGMSHELKKLPDITEEILAKASSRAGDKTMALDGYIPGTSLLANFQMTAHAITLTPIFSGDRMLILDVLDEKYPMLARHINLR